MGKSKAAIPDLNRVIQLKPDFSSVMHSSLRFNFMNRMHNLNLFQARLQRANVHMKQGDLDSAYIDYEAVVSSIFPQDC